MYAIIDFAGHQYKVQEGDKLNVNLLEAKDGDKVYADKVLILFDDKGSDVKVGFPHIDGASVELKVLKSFKGEKVRVFKMTSKDRTRKNRGFRADLTAVEVVKIQASGSVKVAKKDVEEVKVPVVKKTAKKE